MKMFFSDTASLVIRSLLLLLSVPRPDSRSGEGDNIVCFSSAACLQFPVIQESRLHCFTWKEDERQQRASITVCTCTQDYQISGRNLIIGVYMH